MGASTPPIAIGGIGGSGTRLVAEIVRRLGVHTGDDLNEAGDNLWFTLLFKRSELAAAAATEDEFRRAVDVFRAAMCGGARLTDGEHAWVEGLAAEDRPGHTASWLRERVGSLATAAAASRPPGPWGWKEPNTHVFVDRLPDAFPGMTYIHVARNGLDMAYSANQNQFRLWGRHFLGGEHELDPRAALRYWCAVHRRVEALGGRLPGRYLLLNYDTFCAAPRDGVRALCAFLGAAPDLATEATLASLARPPASVGRFRHHGLEPFDADDVDYVRTLGFDTSPR